MRDDNQHFWELLEPLHASAGAFCRMLAGNREDGDDLYQEAVCRALTRINQLREPAAFRPWLYRIIINCHRNRVATPWRRRLERLLPKHEAVLNSDRVAGPIHARLRLEIAMKPLSVKDRALVLLFETEGWSTTELAGLAGVSVDSVKARLSRTRRKMKTALVKYLSSGTQVSIPGWSEQEKDVCDVVKRKPE
jgi:RNA polymerase sigma-70 factor (ECF subfamily)